MLEISRDKAQIQGISRLIIATMILATAAWMSVPAVGSPARVRPRLYEAFLSWQKIVIRHGQVVQEGSHRLPYPIVLPPSVRPLGSVALDAVDVGHDPRYGIRLELFFPTHDEARIREWAEHSVSHFPVPIGKHQITDGPIVYSHPWSYHITAKGKDIKVYIAVTEYPFHPDITRAIGVDQFVWAWTSDKSPVKNEPSFVGIRVIYVSAHN